MMECLWPYGMPYTGEGEGTFVKLALAPGNQLFAPSAVPNLADPSQSHAPSPTHSHILHTPPRDSTEMELQSPEPFPRPPPSPPHTLCLYPVA